MTRRAHIAEEFALRVRNAYGIPTLILTMLLSCVIQGAGASSSKAPTGYALLVLATDETNPTLPRKPGPEEANITEIVLARVYGTLLRAGFMDENITVLYASGREKMDAQEQRYAEMFKRLNTEHFERPHYEATRDNVIRAIEHYGQKIGTNDPFVFWILAHGWRNGALSLEDCTYLLPREIEAAVKRLKSRSNYLLFDCCYSGSILDTLTLDNALMFSTTGSNTRGMLAADFSNCAAFLENLADSSCELDVNDRMDCQKAFSATLAAAQKYNVPGDRQPDDNPGEEHGAQPSGKIPKMKIGDLFMPASFHRPTIAKEVNQKGRSRGSPASKPAATPTGPALGGKSIQ